MQSKFFDLGYSRQFQFLIMYHDSSRQLSPHQPLQHGHSGRAVIQAIKHGIIRPARAEKLLAPADRQLLTRFEATYRLPANRTPSLNQTASEAL